MAKLKLSKYLFTGEHKPVQEKLDVQNNFLCSEDIFEFSWWSYLKFLFYIYYLLLLLLCVTIAITFESWSSIQRTQLYYILRNYYVILSSSEGNVFKIENEAVLIKHVHLIKSSLNLSIFYIQTADLWELTQLQVEA